MYEISSIKVFLTPDIINVNCILYDIGMYYNLLIVRERVKTCPASSLDGGDAMDGHSGNSKCRSCLVEQILTTLALARL